MPYWLEDLPKLSYETLEYIDMFSIHVEQQEYELYVVV
jgi:hypothetical protein